MKKTLKIVALVALTGALTAGVLALTGCNKSTDPTEGLPNKMELDGKVVAWSDSVVKIVLDENASTGYAWAIATEPQVMIVDDEAIYESDGKTVGAPGQRVFTLQIGDGAPASFTDTIGLAHNRSWEAGSDIDALTVFITVENGVITSVDMAN